jgi:predicted phosphodiesterase
MLRTGIFFLISILLMGSYGLAQISSFLIKPYLYTIKGSEWALSWAYESGDGVQSTVKLQINGNTVYVNGNFTNGLYTARLPLAKCDFGDVAYEVPGMTEARKINNVPCPESVEVTKFSFMADTQEGRDDDKTFATNVAKFNGSAVLLGGDLVETGAIYKEWVGFFEALNPAIQSEMLIPVVGNHEYHENKKVPLWELFFQTEAAEDFYALDIGPVHVIAINSCFTDEPSIRLKQLTWLNQELAKPSRWKVVFFHHPPFSRSIMNSKEYPKKEWRVLQQDYVPIFETHHVDLVLNGHTHLYEHSEKAGVQYLTMGPAGGVMGTHGSSNPFTIQSEKVRTILEIEASPNSLRAVTSTISGNQIGELTLAK